MRILRRFMRLCVRVCIARRMSVNLRLHHSDRGSSSSGSSLALLLPRLLRRFALRLLGLFGSRSCFTLLLRFLSFCTRRRLIRPRLGRRLRRGALRLGRFGLRRLRVRLREARIEACGGGDKLRNQAGKGDHGALAHFHGAGAEVAARQLFAEAAGVAEGALKAVKGVHGGQRRLRVAQPWHRLPFGVRRQAAEASTKEVIEALGVALIRRRPRPKAAHLLLHLRL